VNAASGHAVLAKPARKTDAMVKARCGEGRNCGHEKTRRGFPPGRRSWVSISRVIWVGEPCQAT